MKGFALLGCGRDRTVSDTSRHASRFMENGDLFSAFRDDTSGSLLWYRRCTHLCRGRQHACAELSMLGKRCLQGLPAPVPYMPCHEAVVSKQVGDAAGTAVRGMVLCSQVWGVRLRSTLRAGCISCTVTPW
jgi:hypothetical protein